MRDNNGGSMVRQSNDNGCCGNKIHIQPASARGEANKKCKNYFDLFVIENPWH